VGGLVGTAAKTIAEKIFPPRTHGEPEPPDVLVEKIGGSELSTTGQEAASEVVHWTFGALAGAAYGGLVEYYPAAASKEGASFGIALATLTHEGALPALGLAAAPEDQAEREHASEMTSHVVFGVVTEIVRGLVRKML
jgi:putative membrane protein